MLNCFHCINSDQIGKAPIHIMITILFTHGKLFSWPFMVHYSVLPSCPLSHFLFYWIFDSMCQAPIPSKPYSFLNIQVSIWGYPICSMLGDFLANKLVFGWCKVLQKIFSFKSVLKSLTLIQSRFLSFLLLSLSIFISL